MKIKTSGLKGAALDWAVAKCEGKRVDSDITDAGISVWCVRNANGTSRIFSPSSSWGDGGPIIEREGISVRPDSYTVHAIKAFDSLPLTWKATRYWITPEGRGTTPLEAAMKCYVASKLGDEIEVPEELI